MSSSRRVLAVRPPVTDIVPSIVGDALRSPSRPLDPPTRAYMEPRFGHDFNLVRIHADASAAESARALDAQAYTVGNHIVFSDAFPSLATQYGRELISHELAHTIQQGSRPLPSAFSSLQIGPIHNSTETEADTVAAQVGMQGPRVPHPFSIHANTPLMLQRRTVRRDYATAGREIGPVWDVTLRITGAPESDSERLDDFINACMDGIRSAAESLGSGRQARSRHMVVRIPYRPRFDYATIEQQAYAATLHSVLPAQPPPAPVQVQPQPQSPPTPTPSPTPAIPPPAPLACFDTINITVSKNGRTHSCAAFTSSGAPTPTGRFCIRRQGEAQRRGGLAGLLQDRTRWYLLEPQFTTTRSRMMLHLGRMSTGCITVTNAACFAALESILNSGGTVSGTGYDGYPPGNADGVSNPVRPVDCVAWLDVTAPGGCDSAPGDFPEPSEDTRAA